MALSSVLLIHPVHLAASGLTTAAQDRVETFLPFHGLAVDTLDLNGESLDGSERGFEVDLRLHGAVLSVLQRC